MPKRPAGPVKKKPVAAKKSASTSKTPTRSKSKPAPEPEVADDDLSDDDVKMLASLMIDSISRGELDGYLVKIDDALTERMNTHSAEKRRASKKTPGEKKVSSPPKKSKPVASASVEPVKGTTYAIKDSLKKLAGAKVKFIRVKPGDDSKVLVEMMSDKPGFPKGKRVAIPLAAIEEVKKGPARKK